MLSIILIIHKMQTRMSTKAILRIKEEDGDLKVFRGSLMCVTIKRRLSTVPNVSITSSTPKPVSLLISTTTISDEALVDWDVFILFNVYIFFPPSVERNDICQAIIFVIVHGTSSDKCFGFNANVIPSMLLLIYE